MMEETNAREGHRHSVFIAGFYHIIIAHAATSLCHVLHTAFVGALILDEVIRRIPVLRWCVCGMGGR